MSTLAILSFLDGLAGAMRTADAIPMLNQMILILAVLTPICVAVTLTISGTLPERIVRIMGGFGFLVPALGALWLWATYEATITDGGYAFEFISGTGLEAFGIYFALGLNGISMPLFLMAGIVGLAAGFYAIQSTVERKRLYLILLLVMQTGLMGLFASEDIFFYYLFHEFALIPTFVMIAIWGGQGRKRVALEMTIYLTLGAMLTLVGLIALYITSGATTFNMIEMRDALIETDVSARIFGFLLIGFGILVSLFPFHSWAPSGYAKAPASAAMLHAGVLKKFGLYGLIQIALPILPSGFETWAPVLLWLALGNVIIIGFVTLGQRDLKMMLGNASVMHMGYAFLGIYAYSTMGVGGAVLMMVAHGLSIAVLFLLTDTIAIRTGTTEFCELGGLGKKAPVLMGFFVAATMASIGLPGFGNFWGELSIFVALYQGGSPWAVIPVVAGIIISAVYGLRAVASVFFGESTLEYTGGDLSVKEKVPAVILLFALLALGFWPRGISDNLNAAVEAGLSQTVVTHVANNAHPTE